MPGPPGFAPELLAMTCRPPEAGVRPRFRAAWAPGQGLSQEEGEGLHTGWAGKREFLVALATIQRVQGRAWSSDRGARLTMAGHCTGHWVRGHGPAVGGTDRGQHRKPGLVTPAGLPLAGGADSSAWHLRPICPGPAAFHPAQATPQRSLDRAIRLFHDSTPSLLSLCLQKCLSWGPAAW